MRAGMAAGTASSDPFAALVAGGTIPTGRGAPAETTSFRAALELAERMLDAPTGADGSASAVPTVTTGLAAPASSGESASDATGTAPVETSTSAVPVDAVAMIGVPAATPPSTVVPTDAPTLTASAAEGSTPGTTEGASAVPSEAADGEGTGSVLVAPSSSATGGADADAPLDRAAAPARASAVADPDGSVTSAGPSPDAPPVNGAPPTTAASTTAASTAFAPVPVPAATRVEASALPAAPSAPSSAVISAVGTPAASSSGTVADPADPPVVPSAGTPSAPVVAPAASAPTPGIPAVPQPEPPASARSVATQVSPVVVSIAQRPAGSHQLTMTISPETLGPVTVRAHIGQNGDVRVELLGATDAGREALRAIASDLRRDLAAVLPHANLSLTSASASSADSDGSARFGQPDADQGTGGRRSGAEASGSVDALGLRGRASAPNSLPTPALAVAGAGLDTFA